jgi:hypothetical protein
MQWNDTSDTTITSRYNVSGLFPNVNYTVYSNSVLVYTLSSDSNGQITFTINLPANQETGIMVNSSSNILNLHFNEAKGIKTYDSSGYGNNGTYYGETFNDGNSYYGSTPTDLHTTLGKYGNALQFDGINDYVRVSNSPSLNPTNEMTVSAWINPSQFQTNSSSNQIVAKLNWGSSQGFFLREGYQNNSQPTFYVGNGISWQAATAGYIAPSGWYYVTGTVKSNDKIRIYINGTLKDTENFVGNIIQSSGDIFIGRETSSSSYTFNGTIDEVRIWSRALNSTEINTEMNKG